MKFTIVFLFAVLAAVRGGNCPHSSGSMSKGYTKTSQVSYSVAGRCPISGAQISSLRMALKEANMDGSLGAQVGLKYLKAHPESQKAFPSLAGVDVSDLMSNNVFLAKSSACLAGLRPFFTANHFDKSKGCPYTARTRGHYTTAQQLDFGKALVESVVAKLGKSMTSEINSALQATIKAVRSAAGVSGNCPVSETDRSSMRSSLKAANQDGSLGRQTFEKFFKTNPEAQKYFTGNFSAQASTCMSALTLYFNPKYFGTTNGCPLLSYTKGRYSLADQRQFCLALIEAVEEKLGADFSADAQAAFKNAYAMVKAHKKN